jgi:hypothetical protein
MTLPFVLHGVFTAVEETLAEAVESEVRRVTWILPMFETNSRQIFLKFDRFSS